MQEQALNVAKLSLLSGGVDVSRIIRKSYWSIDYFFNIPENEPKYIVNVDKNGRAFTVSTGRLKGRNSFSWGSNAAYLITGRSFDKKMQGAM